MRKIPIILPAVLMVLIALPRALAQDRETERPAKGAQSEVIRLQFAVANEIVPVLTQSLPASVQRRVRIIPDSRTNAIVVSADDNDLKDVRALVASLDVQIVNEKAPAAQPRKAVSYEIVLFALSSGADVSAKLPRTSSGVIDTADPAAVLAKLREAVGQAGVTEVAKLAVMADDGRNWKWRQSVSIPVFAAGGGFNGYQEASVELALSPENVRGGSRRLGIGGRIERFADTAKSNDREGVPPPKSTSTIDFSSSIEDGKLVMSAVESAASKFDASYVLFVRVKN